MGVDAHSLMAFVGTLGDAVVSECSLVAAGGTALTLRGIKQSTNDVDFVVEAGSMADVEKAIKTISGPPTDLFSAGTVFNNLRRVLREVYGVEHGADEEDLR